MRVVLLRKKASFPVAMQPRPSARHRAHVMGQTQTDAPNVMDEPVDVPDAEAVAGSSKRPAGIILFPRIVVGRGLQPAVRLKKRVESRTCGVGEGGVEIGRKDRGSLGHG